MFHKPAHKDNVNTAGQVQLHNGPEQEYAESIDGFDNVDEFGGLSWALHDDILREMHQKGGIGAITRRGIWS